MTTGPTRRVRGELGLGLALVVAIVAVAALWGSPRRPTTSGDARGFEVARPARREPAPGFELTDLHGRRVRLQDLRGHVVLLNFWATWCVPCKEEMPAMETLARELAGQGLTVVAVNYKESRPEVADFVREYGFTFAVLLNPEGDVAERYRVVGLPTSFLIDRNGALAGSMLGFRNWSAPTARAYVTGLLAPRS